ncbi:helix-turn-helix domain-containing protein [Planococcaceae bacterium Storch 2/2-2]|nr:helix-turn-helix domain-containing protein [Planococcaceae bacterium Storch 2/2-2]
MRLKKLRESRGYMQKYVADKIGVKSNTLSGYENGTRSPDPDIIIALADFYDVTTDYLLGNSDTPQLSNQEEFERFKNNPDLERWYKELPENDEEDLEALRAMWEIIKNNKK